MNVLILGCVFVSTWHSPSWAAVSGRVYFPSALCPSPFRVSAAQPGSGLNTCRVFLDALGRPLPKTLRFSEFSRIILGTVLSDPRLSVLAVTITHQFKPDPVNRLASAVFTQALRDCGFLSGARVKSKVQKEAIHFLTSGGEGFRFWCHALNQNPDQVSLVLKKRLTRG